MYDRNVGTLKVQRHLTKQSTGNYLLGVYRDNYFIPCMDGLGNANTLKAASVWLMDRLLGGLSFHDS